MSASLVGSEMCIRDSIEPVVLQVISRNASRPERQWIVGPFGPWAPWSGALGTSEWSYPTSRRAASW
eukprot:10942119-Alexandrium_andersonii.AAC.1